MAMEKKMPLKTWPVVRARVRVRVRVVVRARVWVRVHDAVEDLAGGEEAAEWDDGLARREEQLELHHRRRVRARVRVGAPREQRAHRLQG